MNDPWTFAIFWVCVVGLALLAWGAVEELWARRAPKPVEPEPEQPTIPAHRQCAVTECPREWVTDRSGWRLCHKHYRELVVKDGAA